MSLRHDDIMGLEGTDLIVTDWNWRVHESRASGKEMLAVTYYGGLSDAPITEYLTVLHDGYAADKAMRLLLTMANSGGVSLVGIEGLEAIAAMMSTAKAPALVEFKKDGKFYRVMRRSWE